jgi:16S rRNA (adenine1518-N6/adenine1519-N6)-dimethyltransferase
MIEKKLCNLSNLIAFLKENKVLLKKSFSQNFLVDENIINKLVSCADIKSDDYVLEIGPGAGVITSKLLEKTKNVIAIEKDIFFAEQLSSLKSSTNNLKIINDDFFKIDLDSLIPKSKKIKVVANIPFHITTKIFTTLIKLHNHIENICIIIQHENALRIMAKPNDKNYCSFTFFINYYSFPKLNHRISKNCFFPKPKVDAAIINLQLKEKLPLSEKEELHLFFIVRKAFEKRRKTLLSSLRDYFEPENILKALKEMNLSIKSRPQELSFENFISFSKKLI